MKLTATSLENVLTDESFGDLLVAVDEGEREIAQVAEGEVGHVVLGYFQAILAKVPICFHAHDVGVAVEVELKLIENSSFVWLAPVSVRRVDSLHGEKLA